MNQDIAQQPLLFPGSALAKRRDALRRQEASSQAVVVAPKKRRIEEVDGRPAAAPSEPAPTAQPVTTATAVAQSDDSLVIVRTILSWIILIAALAYLAYVIFDKAPPVVLDDFSKALATAEAEGYQLVGLYQMDIVGQFGFASSLPSHASSKVIASKAITLEVYRNGDLVHNYQLLPAQILDLGFIVHQYPDSYRYKFIALEADTKVAYLARRY